jgi:hypothetical protein
VTRNGSNGSAAGLNESLLGRAGEEVRSRNWIESIKLPPVQPQARGNPARTVSSAQPGAIPPPGTRLNKGDRWTSPSGHGELAMMYDGSLILYRNNPNRTQTQIFDTGTYEGNPHGLGVGDYAVVQADGSLVIYGMKTGGGPSCVIWTGNI